MDGDGAGTRDGRVESEMLRSFGLPITTGSPAVKVLSLFLFLFFLEGLEEGELKSERDGDDIL